MFFPPCFVARIFSFVIYLGRIGDPFWMKQEEGAMEENLHRQAESTPVRVGVTGISGYLAKSLVPLLLQDRDIREVMGIDLVPPAFSHAKLRFVREDIRSPELPARLAGVDTLVHLAYIVSEIRDKKRTHDININGTKNVLNACREAGVRKVVVASSIAAYGAHPDNPIPLTEESPLRGNPECYYSYDKLAVEEFLDGFVQRHPGIIVTRLRPAVVIGPNVNNPLGGMLKWGVWIGIRGRDTKFHLVHEEDVARAFSLAVKRDAPGAFNVADDEPVSLREVAGISGFRTLTLGPRTLKVLADIGFRLGLVKASSHWVYLVEHSVVVSNEKIRRELGWIPRTTSRENLLSVLGIYRKGRDA